MNPEPKRRIAKPGWIALPDGKIPLLWLDVEGELPEQTPSLSAYFERDPNTQERLQAHRIVQLELHGMADPIPFQVPSLSDWCFAGDARQAPLHLHNAELAPDLIQKLRRFLGTAAVPK